MTKKPASGHHSNCFFCSCIFRICYNISKGVLVHYMLKKSKFTIYKTNLLGAQLGGSGTGIPTFTHSLFCGIYCPAYEVTADFSWIKQLPNKGQGPNLRVSGRWLGFRAFFSLLKFKPAAVHILVLTIYAPSPGFDTTRLPTTAMDTLE